MKKIVLFILVTTLTINSIYSQIDFQKIQLNNNPYFATNERGMDLIYNNLIKLDALKIDLIKANLQNEVLRLDLQEKTKELKYKQSYFNDVLIEYKNQTDIITLQSKIKLKKRTKNSFLIGLSVGVIGVLILN